MSLASIAALALCVLAILVGMGMFWDCDLTKSMRPPKGRNYIRVSVNNRIQIFSVPDTVWSLEQSR